MSEVINCPECGSEALEALGTAGATLRNEGPDTTPSQATVLGFYAEEVYCLECGWGGAPDECGWPEEL